MAMNDYLQTLEQYKNYKDISDLITDVKMLRSYYFSGKFEKMWQHIEKLTEKYFGETLMWNVSHTSIPNTVQQAYLNAENFLRLKGFSLLLKNGVKLDEQFTSEEIDFIRFTIKPME